MGIRGFGMSAVLTGVRRCELVGLVTALPDSHHRACVVGFSVRCVDEYVACYLPFDCRCHKMVRSFTTLTGSLMLTKPLSLGFVAFNTGVRELHLRALVSEMAVVAGVSRVSLDQTRI